MTKKDCDECFYSEQCKMSQDIEIMQMAFPKKGVPFIGDCKNFVYAKAKVIGRSQITQFLSDLLVRTRLSGMGKHYASEVTLDYGNGKGKEKRVDFMQFKPANTYSVSGIEKGEFICYEVKSCKADVFSGHGLNIEGERNYVVTTMETWKDLVDCEHKRQKTIPYEFGVMVACHQEKTAEFENPTPISYADGWRLEIVRPAHIQSRKRSMSELLFCMLRSGR